VAATFDTYDGTATAGSDYVAQAGTKVTIPAGATTASFDVLVNGDSASEGNETFEAILTGLQGATAPASTATATILDDETALSINDVSVTEGASGTRLATFTATLSDPVSIPVTFIASTMDGTAAAGSDYVARNGVAVTIPAGTLTKAFSVTVNGDATVEQNETFQVLLGNVVGASLADGTGVATILNDDGPTLSINDPAVVEVDTGASYLVYTVTLSQAAADPVVFSFATTSGGTATEDSDYAIVDLANLDIPAGQLTRTVSVPVDGDDFVEANETVFATISNASFATILDAQGVGTIVNDDGPTLSIADVKIAEGQSGTKNVNFTVQLSEPAAGPVTYSIATANGTATSGSDYTARSLVGETIPAGQTARSFAVKITGETAVEANETFKAVLSAVTGASLYDGQATATLLNDDGPTLSIGDVTVTEGPSGTSLANFTVALSQAAAVPVTYNIATASGSASAGSDFLGKSLAGETIPAGTLSRPFSVTIKGDATAEPNEAFTVALANASGATVFDDAATGTILNDDGPTLAISDVQLEEGASGQRKAIFTVALSQVAAVPVTYSIATGNGTAVANGDYVARTLAGETIPAGSLTRTFAVNVNGDATAEANETFFATLSAATGASILDEHGTATIVNDDGAALAIGDVAISEGASGLKTLTFVVSLGQATTAPVVFDLATADGTASVAGNDYVARALAGQNIPAGMTSKTFGVSVKGDAVVEPDETFTVTLTNISGPATVRDVQAVGTITNDD
jgi:chitinase